MYNIFPINMLHNEILDKTFPLMKLFHYTFIYLCQYRIGNNYTFYQNKTWFYRPIFFSLNSPWIFILYKIKKHVSYLPRNHTPLRRISIRDRIKLKCKYLSEKKRYAIYNQPIMDILLQVCFTLVPIHLNTMQQSDSNPTIQDFYYTNN